MASERPLILVCGASGRVGATGRHVTRDLLERGFPVRGLVFREDDRSRSLAQAGAEVVVADMRDFPAVRSALRGVTRAYFTCSLTVELPFMTTVFAAAAREEGVEAVVNISQSVIVPDDVSPVTRRHWAGETVLDWSSVPTVHVRSTVFADALMVLGSMGIREMNELRFPFGDAKLPPIAAKDVARVVAAVLADPEPHLGQALGLRGERLMTGTDMAEVVGRVLGRRILYRDITDEEYRAELARLGLDEWSVNHLSALARKVRAHERETMTTTVEDVTGRSPQTFEAVVQEHKERLDSHRNAGIHAKQE